MLPTLLTLIGCSIGYSCNTAFGHLENCQRNAFHSELDYFFHFEIAEYKLFFGTECPDMAPDGWETNISYHCS